MFRGLTVATALLFTLSGCGPSKAQQEADARARDERVAKAREAAAEQARQEAEAAKAKEQAAETAAATKFAGLSAARSDGGYIAVLYENGRRAMLPASTMSDAELAWIRKFAAEHPLAKGKSSVVVARTEAKKTIEKQAVENGIEVVQLCAPAKLRDQIGGTCMFYGRVHYLDIAGFPVEDAEIYKVINNVPRDEPYADFRYYVGMMALFLKQKPSPILHFPDGTVGSFEWARQELRKGRPILAALSHDVWMDLPADFLATHPWDGSSKIGHQVVLNGFTYDQATKKTTFHVVNSWTVLSEFDVPVEDKDGGRILIEQSISPRGEAVEQAVKLVAGAVTPLRQVGSQTLYSVETNAGPRRVAAANEAAAKALVEADTTTKDLDTVFGEMVVRIYDYIYENADPRIRDLAAAALLSEIFKIPETVAVPHVDLEVKSSLGTVYFVRVGPARVVKLLAESTADALEKARKMPLKS
jgi:hypothetical protein